MSVLREKTSASEWLETRRCNADRVESHGTKAVRENLGSNAAFVAVLIDFDACNRYCSTADALLETLTRLDVRGLPKVSYTPLTRLYTEALDIARTRYLTTSANAAPKLSRRTRQTRENPSWLDPRGRDSYCDAVAKGTPTVRTWLKAMAVDSGVMHDCCDANMVFDEALRKLGLIRRNRDDPDETEAWNDVTYNYGFLERAAADALKRLKKVPVRAARRGGEAFARRRRSRGSSK